MMESITCTHGRTELRRLLATAARLCQAARHCSRQSRHTGVEPLGKFCVHQGVGNYAGGRACCRATVAE